MAQIGRKFSNALKKTYLRGVIAKNAVSSGKPWLLLGLREKNPKNLAMHALEAKHPSVYEHSANVSSLSRQILAQLKQKAIEGLLPPATRRSAFLAKEKNVAKAALMHDIGKLMIPKRLISRKGLTKNQLAKFRRHPEKGISILQGFEDESILRAIRQHHEDINGEGYPSGLKGNEISLEARIISVADDYCAMVEKRGYNKPKSRKNAIREIMKGKGKKYDPDVVDAFVAAMRWLNNNKKQGV